MRTLYCTLYRPLQRPLYRTQLGQRLSEHPLYLLIKEEAAPKVEITTLRRASSLSYGSLWKSVND
jgi:hypothetical protein